MSGLRLGSFRESHRGQVVGGQGALEIDQGVVMIRLIGGGANGGRGTGGKMMLIRSGCVVRERRIVAVVGDTAGSGKALAAVDGR